MFNAFRHPLCILPLLGIALSACADTQANSATEATAPATAIVQSAVLPSSDTLASPERAATFADWLSQFKQKALAAGIEPALLEQVFAGSTPDESVIKADYAQPEFSRPVWEYLESAASPLRVRNGRSLLSKHVHTFNGIEQQYGVDRHALVAIWGLESNFGNFMGNKSVIRSLATLAYEGRRPAFAEQQLIAALQILQNGDISPSGMTGSWAGAMGQTQFIPTTYLTHAVDFDGDGRRDIWNSEADALASAAHYLKASGWQLGQPWGLQVQLPNDFDYALADNSIRQTAEQWQALGVRSMNGPNIQLPGNSYLLLPAGHRGPAFLVGANFRAILAYNNSSAYALAIGLLADGMKGAPALKANWPKDERPLTRAERIELQEQLNRLGYPAGVPDSIIGANTRKAIRDYQRSIAAPADGYPTKALLEQLRAMP